MACFLAVMFKFDKQGKLPLGFDAHCSYDMYHRSYLPPDVCYNANCRLAACD